MYVKTRMLHEILECFFVAVLLYKNVEFLSFLLRRVEGYFVTGVRCDGVTV